MTELDVPPGFTFKPGGTSILSVKYYLQYVVSSASRGLRGSTVFNAPDCSFRLVSDECSRSNADKMLESNLQVIAQQSGSCWIIWDTTKVLRAPPESSRVGTQVRSLLFDSRVGSIRSLGEPPIRWGRGVRASLGDTKSSWTSIPRTTSSSLPLFVQRSDGGTGRFCSDWAEGELV